MQALDIESDRLVQRRRTLPEAAEADRLAAERAAVEKAIVEVETQTSDLERQQRKADADVEQVRSRRARDQERLDQGKVSSPKELESLQSEIASLVARQSELEDAELEIMERIERAQQRHADLTRKRQELEAAVADAERARGAAYDAVDAELSRIAAERAEQARGMPEELAALYEKLRGHHGSVGAAALRQGRCEGCHIELDALELSRIAAAPPEVLQRCENCRRILIRTQGLGG